MATKEKNEEKKYLVVFPFKEDAPDTLYYSVNGRDFYIDSKTAMTTGVEVPECLKEVIENSRVQAMAAVVKCKELAETAIEL